MASQGLQAEGPDHVFLFGSFSEDEASYFQRLELPSISAVSAQSGRIDGYHSQEGGLGPGDHFRDLGVSSSSGADRPGESSHVCYAHPSQERIPDKVITEARPSDGTVPVEQVSEWGHGDRRHPQGDTFSSRDSPAEQYPPVVDKLPLPQPDQPPPHSSTPQAGAVTSSDSIAGPQITPPVASAIVQPLPEGASIQQQGHVPAETPAPPAVKKPSSWAALLASSAPAPAPATTSSQPGTPTVVPRPPPAEPVAKTVLPAPEPAAPASRAGPSGAPTEGLAADSAAPVAPNSISSTLPSANSQTHAQSGDAPPRVGPAGPRGFVNRGNLCFANATLQALMGSYSFGHLLEDLRQHPEKRREPCPTVGSVLKFWETLCTPAPGHPSPKHPQPTSGVQAPVAAPSQLPQNGTSTTGQGSKAASQGGPGKGGHGAGAAPASYALLAKTGRGTSHLAPSVDAASILESVLSRFSPQHHKNGVQIRQEDAQEFLSYLLDKMHEELCSSYRAPSTGSVDAPLANGDDLFLEEGAPGEQHHPDAVDDSDDGGWETVGARNRTAVTRQHALVQSDISNLFFGKLRSEIKTRGVKASATVQPFSVLQLDISREAVRSVEDALLVLGQAEQVEGYRPEEKPGSHPTTASKIVKVQDLPGILVLHLMRFTYNTRGSVKMHKPISFPFQLQVARDLVYAPAAAASPLATKEGRTYRLFATVVHHGKEPSRGHYTANVRQADDTWLRFDDASVFPLPARDVAREQAYLLLYERV